MPLNEREYVKRTAFGIKAQADYDTALADVDITNAPPLNGDEAAEHTPVIETDQEKANKGHNFSENQVTSLQYYKQ